MNIKSQKFSFILIGLGIIIFLLAGCSENKTYSSVPDFEGQVLELKESNQVLMGIQYGKIIELGYDGEILLSFDNKRDVKALEKGKNVKVWIDGNLNDSQPPQGRLGKFEVISDAPNSEKDVEGFVEPEPSDWVKYTKVVREYMYYRTQAVVNNDINILWDRYPDLKENINRKRGVNVEKYEVESLNKGFDLLDANYSVESHGRIKVKAINDNELIVLVHGGIGYLRTDFAESGGEYLIKVFLKQKDNQWTVVKTDEYLLHEYKEWLHEKENQ